jgi:8-oxo-dGTP pyrophosphatase MutT (NUDIX family)
MIRPSVECWLVRAEPPGPRVLLLHAPAVTGKHPPLWQPVSGGIEPGEDATDACCREVAEESGLRIHPRTLVRVIDHITVHARSDLTLDKTVFAALAPEGEIRLDSREHDHYEWVGIAAVAERLHWDSHRTTWSRAETAITRLIHS